MSIRITHRGTKLSFDKYSEAWGYMENLKKNIKGSYYRDQALLNSVGEQVAYIHSDKRYPTIVRPPLKHRPGR